jgi:hypothetical protein
MWPPATVAARIVPSAEQVIELQFLFDSLAVQVFPLSVET